MKPLNKIFISFLLSVFLLTTLFIPFAKAQGTWYNQEFGQYYSQTFDEENSSEIFGERYTAAQVQWILYAIPGHLLTAISGSPDLWICLFTKQLDRCGSFVWDKLGEFFNDIYEFFGLPQIAGNTESSNLAREEKQNNSVYGFFYNNPLSGVGMVLRSASKIHLVPEASAQGFGFEFGANTVQKLWKITRNIAFGLLVLVVIVMAFMIMFRIKISPQAVVTIQYALPKIVAGILLIAFSYAIAGFLIDLMYVAIGFIALILDTADLSDMGALELFLDLTEHRNVLVLSLQYVIDFFIAVVFMFFSISFFGGFIGVLALIVVIIATIFNMFKILYILIKTYVSILLLIIVAPFQILIGMIPGSTGGFKSWLNSMIANLAVYPVVGLLFVLAFLFLAQSLTIAIDFIGTADNFARWALPFNPTGVLPLTTTWDPPLTFGTNGGRFLYAMTSFAIYMMIPKAANMIKSFFEKRPFEAGSAIGEAIGTTAGITQMYGSYKGPSRPAFKIRGHDIMGDTLERIAKTLGDLTRR
jgi:hypothetical protein